MALVLKLLYAGKPTGGSTLDLVPAAGIGSTTPKCVLVKNIIITNGNTPSTVKLEVVTSDGPVLITPGNIAVAAFSQVVLDAELTLDITLASGSPKNKLRVTVGNPSTLEIVVNGLERDC